MTHCRPTQTGPTQDIFLQYALPLAVFLSSLAMTRLPDAGALALAAGMALLVGLVLQYFSRRMGMLLMEHTALDEQLLQSQKLAILGQMSSGIAHEINTPLAVIAQDAELLRHECAGLPTEGPVERIEARLRSMETHIQRCSEITHGMLQMVRKSPPVRQPTNPMDLCEDMIALVERETKARKITVVRDYAEQLPELTTDPPLLKQVILNLLVNAMQALDSNGTIRIGIRPDRGQSVCLTIQDSGPGIKNEHLDKIFNPFFTTKPPGSGTGLGLSVCLSIVDRLGGTLTAANAPEGGALFTVRLPADGGNRTPSNLDHARYDHD